MMKVSAAIKTIASGLDKKDIALFTTGMISRYAFAQKDRPANFYMLGSMGLLSSIGLGIALNSTRKVFVFDGDGSLLMDMGIMAMVGYHRPAGLCHIVLDNESYYSTGGQATISCRINLASVARAVGYRQVIEVETISLLKEKMRGIFRKAKGPVFILVKAGDRRDGVPKRVSVRPSRLAQRLKNELKDVYRKNQKNITG